MCGGGSGAAPFSWSLAGDVGLRKHFTQGQALWPPGCVLWLDRLYGSCVVSSSPGLVAARRKPGSAAFSPDVARQPKCFQKRTSTCWLPTKEGVHPPCTLQKPQISRADLLIFFLFPLPPPPFIFPVYTCQEGWHVHPHAYVCKSTHLLPTHLLAILKLQIPKYRTIFRSGND